MGSVPEHGKVFMSTQTVDRMTRDVHLSGKDLMAMVQLRPQDIGKYAIVPGPKERLDSLTKKMESPVKNFSFMEYNMYTGNINGIRVTGINGGRFSADTAITTEILCSAQAKVLIRIGSCGALRKDIKIGDFIVTTGCVRGDGVTPYYVKNDFVTLPDQALNQKLTAIAKNTAATAGLTVHEGKVWSTDAILKESKEIVNGVIDQGAIGVDMVSSTFLTIAQTYNIPAVSILAVSDNLITGQMGFINPDYYMAEGMLIQMAMELVKELESK
jgi:uridine phosphorylase